jgi:DNA (cytosine-5)-methyltransferase 1
MTSAGQIPVIDVFAGPGGLAEGFAAFEYRRQRPFEVALSIECEAIACKTLLLRKMVRAWREIPPEYDRFQRGEISLADLFRAFPDDFAAADRATLHAELGASSAPPAAIRTALGTKRQHWVLVGGPPCQAYSLVGRSRMRGTEGFEQDKRHTLYREYLQIVAEHRPSIFVMENVKGILSSTLQGQRIFHQIIADLREPAKAVGAGRPGSLAYRLYGLGSHGQLSVLDRPERATDFLVRAEEYGIPQMRHRIFVVGVRSDIQAQPAPLELADMASVGSVLADLPRVRSRLSGEPDSLSAWQRAIASITQLSWVQEKARDPVLRPVIARLKAAVTEIRRADLDFGGRFVPYRSRPKLEPDWFRGRSSGLTLHETRAHMVSDLHRYLFAAAYAAEYGVSAKLRDFPADLHPEHSNVQEAITGDMFGDRFRVQTRDRPSSTITSHLAKDGHYFIHFDPTQCRSITVREAARLQTFPDDYFFVGNRTEQYWQVGNAVPPLLARAVAGSVFGALSREMRRRA